MTLTIAPEDEACQALVTRINTPTTGYVLPVAATYSYLEIDEFEELPGLRVDVVHDTGKQAAETFDDSDNSSHQIKVWVRSPLTGDRTAAIRQLNLLRRQIFQQLNNWNSSDRRVQVWDIDLEDNEQPLKDILKQMPLYVATISLRVEVQR